MKIHIEKTEGSEKKGLFSSIKIYEIHCKFELNEEELSILNKHPEIKKFKLFDYTYKGIDLSPTVSSFVRSDRGSRIVAYDTNELIEYENQIQNSARQFKDHLMSLVDSTGTSVTEI